MDDYIYHHGIKGQKWGDRNGPPYPLDAEDHSAEEKKKNPGLLSETKSKSEEKKAKSEGKKAKNIKKLEEKRAVSNSRLIDLEKKGINSKTFRETYPVPDNATDEEFESIYGASKEKTLEHLKKITKETRTRANARIKEINGEPLTDEEKALRKKDRARTIALIAGVAIGAGIIAYEVNNVAKSVKYQNNFEAIFGSDSLGRKTSFADQLSKNGLMVDDPEEVIKAGEELFRMSGWKNEQWGENLKRLYVTHDRDDADVYKAFLGVQGAEGRFEYTLQAVRDLKVARQSDQLKVLRDLLDDDDYFAELRQYIPWIADVDADIKKRITQYDKRFDKGEKASKLRDDVAKGLYSFINGSLVNNDFKLSQKYFDEMKKRGFDVIRDDHDRGQLSKNPLIILDPEKNLQKIGMTAVNTGNLLKVGGQRKLKTWRKDVLDEMEKKLHT